MIDKILERFNLKYEDLIEEEKVVLNQWAEAMDTKGITPDSIKTYVNTMKVAVEKELTTTDLNTKQDLFLKARLKNYMLLYEMLSTPERAKQAIENHLSSIKKKIN